MNIYSPRPNCDDYDSFYRLDQEQSFDILNRFLNFGKYQEIEEKSAWIPLEVKIESYDTKRGDFFSVIAGVFRSEERRVGKEC